MNIVNTIAEELKLKTSQINSVLSLVDQGATVPFIARYRKEATESLDENQIRNIVERWNYLTELERRKEVILEAIAAQNKLTSSLKDQIIACANKTELEDLYLPYKPKRRTRATMAKEKGLEPLAEAIESVNSRRQSVTDGWLEQQASQSINPELEVNNASEALTGAADVIAEKIAERAELRAEIRDYLFNRAKFSAKIKDEYAEGTTKYEMYRNYQIGVSSAPPHSILAMYRGEAAGVLSLNLDFDREAVLNTIESQVIQTRVASIREFYRQTIKDAFSRLMEPALVREILRDRKIYADTESIKTFEANLRELLLAPPAGMKPTLAIDPGFRTGCKVAVLDNTGKFLEYQAIFPHSGAERAKAAAKTLTRLIQQYQIELIGIGNGTASRETDRFVAEVIATLDRKPIKVIVNEAGASVYSASEVAQQEFPDLDVTVRGAISIGRRLQDPLAELVKIDPKSIGVGQYQHDVDQKLLKQKLEETVESCVNYVGVDLNTASKQLLVYVSGITPTIANNIVSYRDSQGAFGDRASLLKISKLGPKAFQQAAGFLRIRGGNNPLDNTGVHPESYGVVEQIAKTLAVSIEQITQVEEKLDSLNLQQFVTDTVGIPTLEDVVEELKKPGRDPRDQFQYATFKEGVDQISDLSEGMQLEGVVTNVVNFGAFVDVGVHQDGLVHISQLADRFVSDPKDIVKVGQIVKVKVVEVDEKLKRISLSMKLAQ